MRKLLPILSLSLLPFTIATAAVDPYSDVVTITNTTSWPYDAASYGNDTFEAGTVDSGNTDSLLLKLSDKNPLVFPEDFKFGVAFSSYQYEGNRIKPSDDYPDGVGWSIWDIFSEQDSWLNRDGQNISQVPPTSNYTIPSGEQAIQGYYPEFYEQDIQLMKKLGVNYVRLSISWPRLFPRSNMTAPDPEGVRYYQTLLQKLKDQGFEVLITLYHWDLPAWLYNFGEDSDTINSSEPSKKQKYYGWLDMSSAKDNITIKEFQKYADTCFNLFGKYTPYFSTFNEPLTFSNNGLYIGNHAPGVGKTELSLLQEKNPALYGANDKESLERLNYLQSVNVIKAHFVAYKTFEKYRQQIAKANKKEPMLGIVLNSDWAEPYRIIKDETGKLSYHPDDIEASKYNMDFMLGWWLDPVMNGHWPQRMQQTVGARLPSLADPSCINEQGELTDCADKKDQNLGEYISKGGALDNISLNHYTGYFVADINFAKSNPIPDDEYGNSPNKLTSGWTSDQKNYVTQFRYQLYGDNGNSPNNDPSLVYVIGKAGAKPWLRHTFFSYQKLLEYINVYYLQKGGSTKQGKAFSNLDIYLTENGTSIYQESQKDTLADPDRINYIKGNLSAVWQARQEGIPIKLYTYWSIADNFEWAEGYDSRFGLVWIDYQKKFQRKPKYSFCYYNRITSTHSVPKLLPAEEQNPCGAPGQ